MVPIWRRPWMVLGRDTFAGDLLARLGVSNLYAGHQDRYPRIDIAELRSAPADLVVLPDEPYRFTASDGPETFPGSRTALVSGRHLTWYGPSLTEAPAVLRRQLAAARVRSGVLRRMTTPPEQMLARACRAGARSPLGEWHIAAPAGRYSAKAVVAARGTQRTDG